MKKSILIGISILISFILCSLSYQPIIAEKPFIETKEEIEPNEEEDCECEKTDTRSRLWSFPIICSILFIISELSLAFGLPGIPPIWMFVNIIAVNIFHCQWALP